VFKVWSVEKNDRELRFLILDQVPFTITQGKTRWVFWADKLRNVLHRAVLIDHPF
jgi:hypothetical protein